jgi:hypothetical protein
LGSKSGPEQLYYDELEEVNSDHLKTSKEAIKFLSEKVEKL